MIMKKPIITIMPDFGMGPYAWIIRDGDVNARQVGPNYADSVAGFPHGKDDEIQFNMPKELEEDFSDWVTAFELYADFRRFNWDHFHARGLILAKRLKKHIGQKAIVRYVKPCEDPNYKDNEITVI